VYGEVIASPKCKFQQWMYFSYKYDIWIDWWNVDRAETIVLFGVNVQKSQRNFCCMACLRGNLSIPYRSFMYGR